MEFSVENEVHVHEWMQLFISGCHGNILLMVKDCV